MLNTPNDLSSGNVFDIEKTMQEAGQVDGHGQV